MEWGQRVKSLLAFRELLVDAAPSWAPSASQVPHLPLPKE
jgi:hypothetical protein